MENDGKEQGIETEGRKAGATVNDVEQLAQTVVQAWRSSGYVNEHEIPFRYLSANPGFIREEQPQESTIDDLREGFDRNRVDEVADLAQLTKKEVATMLGVSERHLYNATPRPLNTLQSEHLLALESLFTLGLAVFDGNKNSFSTWLRTTKQALAVPQTGFPLRLPANYKQPLLEALFSEPDEATTNQFFQQNNDFNRAQAQQQTKPYPTPLSLLDTTMGVKLVGDILGRIMAGVYS